jgi:O-acetylserine/cysteine efflux transporter
LKTRDLMLAASVPLVWGLGFTVAKAGLAEFPPLFLMGMRFTLAALLLVWFVPIPRNHFKHIFWIALVGSTIQYGLTFTGLSYIDASLAIIIVHLEVPFSVLLAAIILGERPGYQRWLGMLLAFMGIALIAGQPQIAGQVLGVLLTAGGAMTWAVGQLMVKRLGRAVAGLPLIAWIGVFAGPQMLLGSFLLEDGQTDALYNASWIGWGSVAYLGIVMTVVGYGAWFTVLARNPMSQVMPVLLLLPVFTIASSMLLLGEQPSPQILTGGGIVLAGVAAILFTRTKPERPDLRDKA